MTRFRALIAALALLAAACGGDDSGDSPTTAGPDTTTTTSQATTTTMTAEPGSGPAGRPATSVSAVLGADPLTGTYFTVGGGGFDPAVMGIEAGGATAEWYRAEGFFLVYFDGVDTAATGPLCPGASIATDTFQFVSNAPSEGADCSGFTTLVDDPAVRALECNGSIAYRTAIPDDTVGFLFATLEKPFGGGIMGITSFVDSTSGDIPGVDPAIFEC